MTFTFFSNFLNHHQLPLCLAWYEALGADFTFVATQPFDAQEVAASYCDMNTAYPFCLAAYESAEASARAQRLIDSSDIVLYGAAPVAMFAARLAQGKLTFRYSERIFKPDYTRNMQYTYLCAVWESICFHRRKNAYLLSAGAYTAHDYAIAGGFRGRAYRWGYFPAVESSGTTDTREWTDFNASGAATTSEQQSAPLRILWAGRMIPCKCAEKVLPLVQALQEEKLPFVLTMAGDGPLRTALEKEFAPFQTNVHFSGMQSVQATRQLMRESDIFLFTSDENEGWGAVLSEAMADGCAVLTSHTGGAAPFLVRDGENGLLFDASSETDFVQKGLLLAHDKALRVRLGERAARTMHEVWNAQVAAQRFLQLGEALLYGNRENAAAWEDGPCSRDAVLTPRKMKKIVRRRTL
ncbi:MAG: glycosyltransferase family 4 protein [Ruthenibacterium sp.]